MTRKLYDKLRFKVIPFDEFAAMEFANWWGPAMARKEHTRRKVTRRSLAVDFMILAVAKSQNTNLIYTEDVPMRDIAEDMGFTAKSGSDLQPLQPDMIHR